MGSMFEEGYSIAPLRKDLIFPNPRHAATEGLLAFGGDLSPNRLLTAYRKGIFPWYNADDPILWWSPDPRMLLYPIEFKVSRSFRRVLRNSHFRVKFDHAFEEVIRLCGTVPRRDQNGTWLISEMQEAYIELHDMGFAHSVEVYLDEELVGGLYGIAMGKAFFGESMFSLKSNASKVAFKALSDVLGLREYDFIDCQIENDHLLRMGATIVSRDNFLDKLEQSLEKPSDLGSWRDFKWEFAE
ncbi:MAG: leucyl/phenylalanyl-tRNA--protein transferase [Campylobacterota bacterium]|nr:leucyl/phenylalanyl-tRNA--protein transferase [Campylobacterota bacterium]